MKKYTFPLFLLVILTGIQIALSTLAQTIIPANDGTNTNINVNNNQIDINGGTLSSDGANLFHSFEQFGLTSGQIANFLSNPNINNILGRVTGGDPSYINGLIQVTGGNSNLFLMNPSGIIFGNNASLNVPADFTATTATGIGFNNSYFSAFGNNNYSDLIGNPNAFIFDSPTGTIINSGNLLVLPEHDLNLIGNNVINTGTIKAEGGNINLVAVEGTNRVKLSQEGHILSLEFETPVDREITVLDLPVLLTGSNNITDLSINEHNQVITNFGTIIPNNSGIAINSGVLDVSSPLNRGGNINIFGNIVGLIDQAQLNLNGNMGGGIALIGGDYQGNGTVPNAQNTVVGSQVKINADALSEGNGGRVIIWADGDTRFYGDITAQGGNISGNGGFVEVSGKQNLDFQGNVNTSAVNGDFGTLLLDPTDITISNIASGNGDSDILDGDILTASTPLIMTLSEASLEALAYNTNIIIQAANDITIGTLSNTALNFAYYTSCPINCTGNGGGADISFIAGGNFLMNTTDIIHAPGRNISISAGNNVTLGNIYTNVHTNNYINGGSVDITATSGNIDVNLIDSSAATYHGYIGNSGNVSLNAPNGNINVTNGIYSNTITYGSGDTTENAGNITLSAPNGIITVPVLDSSVNIGTTNYGRNGGIINITGQFNLSQATSILSYGGNYSGSTGGNININGTVNGNYDLSFNAGTGNINFNDTVGDVTALSNLIVVNTTGTTNLNGNITTTGLQTYNNLVNLNNNTTLTGSSLILANSLNGNSKDLTLNFANQINLNNSTFTNLNNFTSNGTGGTLINGDFTTIGNQTYNSAVTLNDNTTLTGASLILNNSLNGNSKDLTLNFADQVNLNNSTFTNLNNLDVTATNGIFIYGDFTTTGNQTYNNAVTLNNNTSLTGASLILANSLNGNNQDLTLNFTEQINLNSSTFTNLNNLDVTATNGILLGDNFTTTGNQTYNSAVTLNNDTSLNGNIINFNNTLNSDSTPRTLTINSNQVFFNNLTGNLNPLNQLDITSNNLTINNNLFTNSNINLNTPLIALNNANISSSGGNFNLQNTNNLNITGAGDILTNGGNITVNAPNIEANNINFDSSNINEQGGSIDLIATNQAILTGNLNSSGLTGGNITVQAETAITTKEINSSGSILNGGSIILDPRGDIQVSFINAQGGINGMGGNIDITAGQYFRATDTFLAQNDLNASLSSIGGLGGGSIIIRHGGNGITPFIIGDASLNGTMGVITSGDYSFNTLNSYLQSEILGDLQILTTFNKNLITQNITTDIQNINTLIEPNGSINEAGKTSVPLVNMSITSNNLSVEAYVEKVDQTFTDSFSSYFGNAINTQSTSMIEVQDQLKKVEEITGITPAIVHASFVPTAENAQQNDQLQLIFTSPEGQSIIHKVNVSREEIYYLSQKFIGGVTNPRRPHGYEQYSEELYQWLIEPLKEDLERYNVEHISFAVDQGLRSIPWAALSDGKQFLIEKYSISQMPSVYLTNLDYTDIRNSEVLAMGADTFTNQNPLPAVPMELDLVSNHLWQGQSYLNQEFSIANLRNARNENPYGIIHLATHGEFSQGRPEDSYIQFGSEKLSLDQLGTLKLSDPPVELMVLSACRSALGDKDAEMGFAGLAVLAGVKSALGSLWYISDAGTLGLISEFYEKLQTAPIKSEALRQTQIAMLKGEVKLENNELITTKGNFLLTEELKNLGNIDLNHPYYWSAFTIIGNPW